MTATYRIATAGTADAAQGPMAGPYVLNLCSSTTPMALAQTDLPELKRFQFFVSRRFEEGRERFRLHMGYFATLAEAEEWLSVVREIYPGAWAGEAPGRKLRERAAAAAAQQASHAAGPRPHPMPAPPPAAPAPRAPAAAAAPPVHVPTLQAAGVPRTAPAAGVAPRAPAPQPPLARPASAAAVARAAPAQPARPAPAAAPARAAAPKPAAPAAPARRAAGTSTKSVFIDSNVKEVLQALTDSSATGETRLMRAPPPPPPAPQPEAAKNSLTDTQVLKLLEVRRAEGSEAPAAAPADAAHGSIPVLKPDDIGTRLALKEAVSSNAPVLFAVQLQWSVQPVELDKVPPLAIFSAYTLYTVEGSRDGRRWYGLRLGFFSDAISAKQVAHYVRSEFTSVAVVPVSPQEKGRATEQDSEAATLGAPAPKPAAVSGEFKLLDDAPAAPVRPLITHGEGAARVPGRPLPKVAVGRKPVAATPPAAARTRARGRVGARERGDAHTLEETLEILGASELSIDDGRAATLSDTGVRHLQVQVQKNSPFSRLLERLSERAKKA